MSHLVSADASRHALGVVVASRIKGRLHGATAGWRGDLISYEAPTYFGMLTAPYLPS